MQRPTLERTRLLEAPERRADEAVEVAARKRRRGDLAPRDALALAPLCLLAQPPRALLRLAALGRLEALRGGELGGAHRLEVRLVRAQRPELLLLQHLHERLLEHAAGERLKQRLGLEVEIEEVAFDVVGWWV